ncbi:RNA polymerase II C-terminal domain kinase beta subunit [Mitosporidium daphniae]
MFLPIDFYLFDKGNSSIIHDNHPLEEQKDTRLASVIFMRRLGDLLGLPFYTILSASYFFHYFFMFYSMKKYSYIDVAITCILVASKSEETYRKIKQILTSSCLLLNPSFKGIGSNSGEFDYHRDLVASYERLLLDVIKFNFTCHHPHEYALKFSKILCIGNDLISHRLDRSLQG